MLIFEILGITEIPITNFERFAKSLLTIFTYHLGLHKKRLRSTVLVGQEQSNKINIVKRDQNADATVSKPVLY